MKKTLRNIALTSLTAIALAACGGGGDSSTLQSSADFVVQPDGTSSFVSSALTATIASLPLQTLSTEEAASLTYMREEEKLAHDVYARLNTLWGSQLTTFDNIAQSEATHTEAVRLLLVRYKLSDPAENMAEGLFVNPTLQALYYDLVAQGASSLVAGLQVGAAIEELDLIDIQNALAYIDNRDIVLVYNNLMKGSRNHLRAFVQALAKQGVTYTPIYLSLDAYNAIINTAIES